LDKIIFASFQVCGKWASRKQWLSKYVIMNQRFSWEMPEAFIWDAVKTTGLI